MSQPPSLVRAEQSAAGSPEGAAARLRQYRQSLPWTASRHQEHSDAYYLRGRQPGADPARATAPQQPSLPAEPAAKCDLCQECSPVHFNVGGGFYTDVCDDCLPSVNVDTAREEK